MNGDDIYNNLKTDLEVLKALFNERWDNHDKRSESIWEEIKDKLKKLDDIPCEVHKERIRGVTSKVLFLEWVVFVVVILGIILRVAK